MKSIHVVYKHVLFLYTVDYYMTSTLVDRITIILEQFLPSILI